MSLLSISIHVCKMILYSRLRDEIESLCVFYHAFSFPGDHPEKLHKMAMDAGSMSSLCTEKCAYHGSLLYTCCVRARKTNHI